MWAKLNVHVTLLHDEGRVSVKIYNKWNCHCRLNLSFYFLEHWLTSLLEHGRYLLSTLTHLALWKLSRLFMVGCLEDMQLLHLTIQKRPFKMGTMEADFSHMDSVQGDSFFPLMGIGKPACPTRHSLDWSVHQLDMDDRMTSSGSMTGCLLSGLLVIWVHWWQVGHLGLVVFNIFCLSKSLLHWVLFPWDSPSSKECANISTFQLIFGDLGNSDMVPYIRFQGNRLWNFDDSCRAITSIFTFDGEKCDYRVGMCGLATFLSL
jgi:hypothetical protein